jgi:hypothetical protein
MTYFGNRKMMGWIVETILDRDFNKISRIGQVLKRYSQSVGKHGWHMGYTGDIIAGSDRQS